jgi:tetratricopeptide (TPR) repeat protein
MKTRWMVAGVLFGMGVAPAVALGGMGYGGYGGGGMSNMGSAVQMDDYAVGMRDLHAEKYADAIPHLERALASRPHSADIMSKLGFANVKTANYQLAYGWLQKALSEDADHKDAHEYLGELYLIAGDPARAQAQLAELVRLCPNSCDERDMFTKEMADYQIAHPAAAAATAPATPPAAMVPTAPGTK